MKKTVLWFLFILALFTYLFSDLKTEKKETELSKQENKFDSARVADSAMKIPKALNINVYNIKSGKGKFFPVTTEIKKCNIPDGDTTSNVCSVNNTFKSRVKRKNSNELDVCIFKHDVEVSIENSGHPWLKKYVGSTRMNASHALDELYDCMMDNPNEWKNKYGFEGKCLTHGPDKTRQAFAFITNYKHHQNKPKNVGTMFRDTKLGKDTFCDEMDEGGGQDNKCLNDAVVMFSPSKEATIRHVKKESLNLRVLMHEIGHMFKMAHEGASIDSNDIYSLMNQTGGQIKEDNFSYDFSDCYKNYLSNGAKLNGNKKVSFPGEEQSMMVMCQGSNPVWESVSRIAVNAYKNRFDLFENIQLNLHGSKLEYIEGEPVYLEMTFTSEDGDLNAEDMKVIEEFILNVNFKFKINEGEFMFINRMGQQPFFNEGKYLIPVFTNLDYQWLLPHNIDNEQPVDLNVSLHIEEATTNFNNVNVASMEIVKKFDSIPFVVKKNTSEEFKSRFVNSECDDLCKPYIQLLLLENPSLDDTRENTPWKDFKNYFNSSVQIKGRVDSTALISYMNYQTRTATNFCVSGKNTSERRNNFQDLKGIYNKNKAWIPVDTQRLFKTIEERIIHPNLEALE